MAETNLLPVFWTDTNGLQAPFSPYIYNLDGSHIQHVLQAVTNNQSGSGSILQGSIGQWLNESFPSATEQFCIRFVIALLPSLALLAQSLNNADPTYLKTRIQNIMKACSLGLTREGVQSLSWGIFNCDCSIIEGMQTVTVEPFSKYNQLQALAFLSIARRIAPATTLVFVKGNPYTVQWDAPSNIQSATKEPING